MNKPPLIEALTVIPTQRQMSLIRFNPSGEYLFAAGRDGRIHRWDLRATTGPPADALLPSLPSDKPVPLTFPELLPLSGHDGWVTQIAFHFNGTNLFSVDSWGRLIGWSLDTADPRPIWNHATAHDGWIRQIALDSTGQRLATCGKDKAIRIWSTSDGRLLKEFANQPEDVYSVAVYPDGKSLVSGDLKGIVKHWDLTDGKVVREFDATNLYLLSSIQDVGGVRVLAFDSTGKTLAIAGAQPTGGGFVQAIPVLKFFDWESGKEIQSLKLGENTLGFVTDLVWHTDGYWLGVCSGQPGQGNVFLQRTSDEKPFFTKPLPNCHSIAQRPDGKQFAVISNSGSFGQGKSMAREGNYPGNFSPIHLFGIT